jgi:hypothetical protein
MSSSCILTKIGFNPSHGSEEDFQRFPIFQPIRSHGSHLYYWARSADTILEEEHSKSITSEFGPIWPSGSGEDQMQKVNGWQTTDTKWWEMLIWALGPGELKTFLKNYQMDTPTNFEHNWSYGFRKEIKM